MPSVSDNEPENAKNNDAENENEPANATNDDSVDKFPYRCTQCGTGRET